LREGGVDAAVREGVKSQFDVFADGELVFSKQSEGRWPDDGEVFSLLNGR
jgi:hypothetical protein